MISEHSPHRPRHLKALAFGLLAACSTLAVVAKDHKDKDDDHEEVIAWADVPAVVQQAIQKEAAGAAILEVEAEQKHGKLVYEAKVKRADDSVWEITVKASGKVKKIERDDDGDDEHESAGEQHEDKKSKKSKKKD